MTELHHCLGLEKGSMTPVVDRLVDLHLVKRDSVAGDRRKVKIVLTRLGRETAELLKVEIAEFIREKLDKLDPADRERFYQAIEILSDISRKL